MTRFEGMTFPFCVNGERYGMQSSEHLTFDVLKPSNFDAYCKGVEKWENGVSKMDVETRRLYELVIRRPFVKIKCLANDDIERSIKRSSPVLVFASSPSAIEGIFSLDLHKKPAFTRLGFIGLAPWNLRTEDEQPKLPNISVDLMRLSLLISLYGSPSYNPSAYVFHTSFVTERGISFGKRFFCIEGVTGRTLYVSLRRKGVAAFLDGNMGLFAGNASITSTFPISIRQREIGEQP